MLHLERIDMRPAGVERSVNMNAQRLKLAQKFLELHRQDGCFIVPNAWDIGSAKILEAAGFAAIATTSAGIAFSLGRVDHGYAPASSRSIATR